MTDLAALSDTDLLRQMRSGTAAAFQALYRRHQGPLYRFALLRCGAPERAADVVQDTFLALLTDKLAFDPTRGALGPFLFGVARMQLLKQESGSQRQQALPEDEDGEEIELASEHGEPLAAVLEQETAQAVRHAIGQLAPHYRDVLILYEFHELSYLEIAAICQVDLGTVRSRLARARSQLAKRLLVQQQRAA